MNIDDLVRLEIVPVHMLHLKGTVGYIKSFNQTGTKILFHPITSEGKSLTNPVWLPVNYFIKENRKEWKDSYNKFLNWKSKLANMGKHQKYRECIISNQTKNLKTI